MPGTLLKILHNENNKSFIEFQHNYNGHSYFEVQLCELQGFECTLNNLRRGDLDIIY